MGAVSLAGNSTNKVEGFFQAIHQEVGVVFTQAHGRLDAQDVAEQAAFANQQAAFLTAFEEIDRFAAGRLFGCAVANQFDAEHEPKAPDFTNERLPLLEIEKSVLEMLTNDAGVLLDI